MDRVLQAWGLTLDRVVTDIEPSGSPERTRLRRVVDDITGRRFVLENIRETDLPHKQSMAETVDCLTQNGLSQAQTYLKNSQSGFIACIDHRYWQITPFVQGTVLDRPAYTHDQWRGPVLARFLLDLWSASSTLSSPGPTAVFSIRHYIESMVQTLARHRSDLLKSLTPVLNWLEQDFMAVHDRLGIRFCHGDLHPLNVIWSTSGILTVIDWEFSGFKPEIYDIANLVGCLGMEDPTCLDDDLVLGLTRELRDSGSISETGWQLLPEFITALRFAWMSEWLRNDDREMIALEQVYMNLIMNHARDLKQIWYS